MKRFRERLDRRLEWPLIPNRDAIIVLPLFVLALPLAARDEIFPSRAAIVAYAIVGGIVAMWWVAEVICSIARTKEVFYQKEVRPILGKEYRDG